MVHTISEKYKYKTRGENVCDAIGKGEYQVSL